MKRILRKIIKGIKERGWDLIPDWCKHFMGSLFLVLILYGIPYQWFNWQWHQKAQLFMAAVLAWAIGILWEILGNMSHKDIWVDFAGVLAAVLLCAGGWVNV